MHWREIGRSWGTTQEERERSFPCDKILPDYNDFCHRGITVFAKPATVFRWLCQLRVAPYSYDWIDNLGRKSPQQLTPGLESLERGQRFMSMFELVDFERDVHITLRALSKNFFPPLVVSYFIETVGDHECRLLVKLVTTYRPRLLDRVARHPAPWLDWIMMRRQLLNLKQLAENSTH